MSSEHWDDNGCCTWCGAKGNGYQVCPTDEVRELQHRLAISEKERERLKGELEKPITCDHCPRRAKHFTCSECGVMMGDNVADERDSLRRQLENLQRETSAHKADLLTERTGLLKVVLDLQVECRWLKRELDRERASHKRKGI